MAQAPWQSVRVRSRFGAPTVTDETLDGQQGREDKEKDTVALADFVEKVRDLQIALEKDVVSKKFLQEGDGLGERVGGATWHRGQVCGLQLPRVVCAEPDAVLGQLGPIKMRTSRGAKHGMVLLETCVEQCGFWADQQRRASRSFLRSQE